VQEINSESLTLSTIGYFVESTRQELGLLRSFSIVHIKREANLTAPGLARGAATHSIGRFWIEEILLSI
jgi:hypothetical protein